MCGIVAIVNFDGDIEPAELSELNSTVLHRGPDDSDSMSDLIQAIRDLEAEALGSIQGAADLDVLRTLEVSLLGRKGSLTGILRGIKDLDDEERRTAGRLMKRLLRGRAARRRNEPGGDAD